MLRCASNGAWQAHKPPVPAKARLLPPAGLQAMGMCSQVHGTGKRPGGAARLERVLLCILRAGQWRLCCHVCMSAGIMCGG